MEAKNHESNLIVITAIDRYTTNNKDEKITQSWLAEKGVQFLCNTSANL